nr:chromate transporter [Gammaproteobacteria bacterium]
MSETTSITADAGSAASPQNGPAREVSFAAAFRVWVRVALLSFGGPAGQIAVMHRILVEEKRWIDENRFLHALNYCMFLPGPEAQQLAIYIGWLLHKTLGGLAAGILFVLPGFVSILALSILYAGYQEISVVQALFFGLTPAVLAVVVQAVLKIGSRALKNRVLVGLAAVAFIGIF